MQLNMFSSCQLEELMDTGPVSVSGNWLLHFVFFCPVWSLWLKTRPSDGTLTVLSWSVTRMVGGYRRFAPEISSKPKRSLIISCLNWSKLKWRGIWRYDQTVLNNRLPSRGQATQFGFKKLSKKCESDQRRSCDDVIERGRSMFNDHAGMLVLSSLCCALMHLWAAGAKSERKPNAKQSTRKSLHSWFSNYKTKHLSKI